MVILILSSCDLYTDIFGEEDDKSAKNMTRNGITEKGNWTFMVYMAADNNLEPYLLSDVEEMVNGYVPDNNYNVVLFVDRAGSDVYGSTTEEGLFYENFTDSRMYVLENNGIKRISGGDNFPEITLKSNYEANTGDANNLKKFIQSAKAQYPAEKYALIFWNHGAGPRSLSYSNDKITGKDVCFDSTSNDDSLFIGEISDVLGKEESVDFIGFDACLMGSIEIAYQFRNQEDQFSAHVMVASPAEEWAAGWNYEYIFKRFSTKTTTLSSSKNTTVPELDNEIIYNPYEMNAIELASICVEEYHDIIEENYIYGQTMAAYDLMAVSDVKESFDKLSRLIVNRKDLIDQHRYFLLTYFNDFSTVDKITTPLYDFYDLCEIIKENEGDTIIGQSAQEVLQYTENLILFSYADNYSYLYTEYKAGKNGISIFMPFGDESSEITGESKSHWETQFWYNPDIIITSVSYGNLFWCKDGAIEGNNSVENWFELLDCWYDNNNLRDSNEYLF